MSFSVKTIEKTLGDTRLGFSNAKVHPEIMEKIIDLGYDDVRIDELIVLINNTHDQYQDQQRRRGEQTIATQNLNIKLQMEIKRFRHFRRLFKRALRGREFEKYLNKLGLNEEVKTNMPGFVKQTRQLYTTAPQERVVMEKVAKFAITAEKMQQADAEIDLLVSLDHAQESAKGLAQVSREDRDSLCKRLTSEWTDFKEACRIAFADSRQYLEVMGITAYSPPVRKKKKTTVPVAEEPQPTEPEEPSDPVVQEDPPATTDPTTDPADTTES